MPNVLLIEDEQDSARLLSFELEDAEFQIELANSGKAGIEKALANPPDIILLDLHMPDMSGLEVLEQLKRFAETVDLPVIVVSANATDQSIVNALDIGANDYVTKPIIFPVLAARMRSALRLKTASDQLEQANTKLKMLATTDPLTHLYNRRHFFSLAYAEFSKSVRHNRPLAFILLDVDQFKEINDRYSHRAGDLTLITLAQCCHEAIRESDIVGRIGGGEFAICCPDSDLLGANRAAERIRERCEANTIHYDGHIFPFTISLAITSQQSDDRDFEALFNRADRLLYEAKRDGRNRALAS